MLRMCNMIPLLFNFLYKISRAISYLSLRNFIRSFAAFNCVFFNNISRYPKSVRLLENKFERISGTQYNISSSSGTTAFEAICFAAGIKRNDAVIVPQLSFYSVVGSILLQGIKPVFCGFDKELNPILHNGLVTPRTKAILVSHLFGLPLNIHKIVDFANKHKIQIIADCSHAHGASIDGHLLGSLSDFAFYSLQGDKAVSGGEGGVACTNTLQDAVRLQNWLQMGRGSQDGFGPSELGKVGIGKKARIPAISAALALVDLNSLAKRNETVGKKIEGIYATLATCEFIMLPSLSRHNKIGGFHYGIPLWVNCDSIEKVISCFSRYRINLFSNPYPIYERSHFFSTIKAHDDVISALGKHHLICKEDNLIEWGERCLLIDGKKFALRFIPLQVIQYQPALLTLIKPIVRDSNRGTD